MDYLLHLLQPAYMQDRTVQRSLNGVLLSERERVTRWCTVQIPAVLSACIVFWRWWVANLLSVLHHAMCPIHLSHWPAQGSKLVTHSAQKLSKTRCPLESGKPRICGRSPSPVHCLQLQGRYVSPLSDWCVHLSPALKLASEDFWSVGCWIQIC